MLEVYHMPLLGVYMSLLGVNLRYCCVCTCCCYYVPCTLCHCYVCTCHCFVCTLCYCHVHTLSLLCACPMSLLMCVLYVLLLCWDGRHFLFGLLLLETFLKFCQLLCCQGLEQIFKNPIISFALWLLYTQIEYKYHSICIVEIITFNSTNILMCIYIFFKCSKHFTKWWEVGDWVNIQMQKSNKAHTHMEH